jgi:hypothetical protein
MQLECGALPPIADAVGGPRCAADLAYSDVGMWVGASVRLAAQSTSRTSGIGPGQKVAGRKLLMVSRRRSPSVPRLAGSEGTA